MQDNVQKLINHLNEAVGCSLSERQAKLLQAHVQHVLAWNTKVNLTRIAEQDSAEILHIEDSLTAVSFVESAVAGRLIDMGTGGGFPGIPLAIVTGRSCTLLDSRDKKIAVLQEFIERQSLEELLCTRVARAEELAMDEAGDYSIVTARALSSLASVAELATPFLRKGGILIAYKGRLSKEELHSAQSLEELLGMQVIEARNFVLSDGENQRTLVVLEKVSEPKLALPRRVGMAQKKPLTAQ